MKVDSSLTASLSDWIIELIINSKLIKLLKDNIKDLHDIFMRKGFSIRDKNHLTINKNINRLNYIKIKKF